MVIKFIPQPKPTAQSAEDDRARKRATVYSIFTPAKGPDGSVRYSKTSDGARRPDFPVYRGRPDPWDGGDAA